MQAAEFEILTKPHQAPSILSDRIAQCYSESSTKQLKKQKGQFFTPIELASFMASLADINTELNQISILDPGCGTLSLTCHLIEQLVKANPMIHRIVIDAYDIDKSLEQPNKEVIDSIIYWGSLQEIDIKVNFITDDFILYNQQALLSKSCPTRYDYVISNPPYFKIGKEDPRLNAFNIKLHGQQNIYGLFLLASLNLLKEGGQLIFLIPRSFSSGPYFQSFREYFLTNTTLKHIHIFESRVEGFKKDKVLQENIVLKASKIKSDLNGFVTISNSKGLLDTFNSQSRQFRENSIIQDHGKHKIIHLPVNEGEEFAISIFRQWRNSLESYGFRVSTGPVVPFRSAEHLAFRKNSRRELAPLIWMHNCLKMRLDLSKTKKEKQPWIKVNTKSNSKTLETKNYVLLRRFSSKDDEYKLVATPVLSSELQHPRLGIENHLNYLHKPGGELSKLECLGLAVLYNSKLFESYFRSFSGNTQISATELNNAPMPPLELIIEIGERYQQLSFKGIDGINSIVEKVLNL